MISKYSKFVFLFCVVFSFSIVPKNAFFYLEKGDKELEKQKISTAIFFYQKSLQKNPKLLSALLKLSQIYRSLSVYSVSSEYLEKALFIEPDNYDVIVEHLYTLLVLRKEKEYNKLLQKAYTIFPYNSQLGYFKALFHIENNNYDLAKTILLRNLKMFPQHLLSLISLGEVYIQLGELILAEEKFHDAIQRESDNNIYILYKIAQAYSQIQDISNPSQFEYIKKCLEKAIEVLRNILKYNSNYPQANFLLARIYSFLGNPMDKIYLNSAYKHIPQSILLETYQAWLFPEMRERIYNKLELQNVENSIFRTLKEYNIWSKINKENLELTIISDKHYKTAKDFLYQGNYQQSLWYANYSLFFHPENVLSHKLIFNIYDILGYKILSLREAKKIKTLTSHKYDQYIYEKLARKYNSDPFINDIMIKEKLGEMKKANNPIQFIFLNFVSDNLLESTPRFDELLAFLFRVTIKDEYLYTVLSEEIHESIRMKIKSYYPFQIKYYFLPQIQNDIVEVLRIQYPDLDISNTFVVFGNYKEALDETGLFLRTKVLHLVSGFEYPEISIQNFGENYMYSSVYQTFASIKRMIPINGTIFLKKENFIFVDIGTMHNVQKDTKIFFPYKKSKIYFMLEKSEEFFSKWKILDPKKILFVKRDKKVILEN